MRFKVNSEAIHYIMHKQGFLDEMQLYKEINLIFN